MTSQIERIGRPVGEPGWYWARHDDAPLTGPFNTEQEARDDWWQSGEGEDAYGEHVYDAKAVGDEPQSEDVFRLNHPYVARYRKPFITTDVVDADFILDWLEDRNEDAVWQDAPPDWPADDKKRDLEMKVAHAIKAWMDQHDLWREFRALEAV